MPDRRPWESPRPSDDLELVRAALAGDEAAVAAFLSRMECIPRMLAARNARMPKPLGTHEILDLSQETFLSIWRRLPAFQGWSSLESWVYPFCGFVLMHAFRHRRRRPPGDTLPEDLVAPTRSGALELPALHEALLLVEPRDAAIVQLKHFEGLTFEEIAKRTGISSNTAKSRYYRGIRRLQEQLGADTMGKDVA